MGKLEAQAIIEDSGNYDEEDTEYIMDIYDELMKHVGFEDNRRDKRFIVKFHDIFYYTPEYVEEKYDINIDTLFGFFCDEQYECLKDDLEQNYIDIDYMLTTYNVGHYREFLVDIPEITEENAAELAMEIYDECSWEGKEYIKNYIYMVEALQNMEDYYMDNWFEFLRAGEYMPEEEIKNMEEKYHKDMERRKAT